VKLDIIYIIFKNTSTKSEAIIDRK